MHAIVKYILDIILLLSGSASTLLAQQQFVLKGAVMELGTTNRINGVQIYNVRTKFTSRTDNMGLFEVKASVGDSLIVYRTEYSDATIVVSSPKDLIIKMRRSTTLQEVEILGKSKRQELDDIKQDFRDKGSFYQGKPPALSFFFKPLTALYETFGRTPRNARRFGEYYETEMEQTAIDGLFNESLIKANTDLRDKELEEFMLYFRPTYDKAKDWTKYDAIKYIKDSAKGFKESLKSEQKSSGN